VFNPKAAAAWAKVEAEHVSLGERVEELRAKVKDGGPLDSDGEANGEIAVNCAPMDTFWGYAIGTLVIRFFGVFLVLVVLQIGMQVASRIFRRIETRAARAKEGATVAVPSTELGGGLDSADAGVAAAIALALHMHLSAERAGQVVQLRRQEVSAWTLHGRERIMGERFVVYDRSHRTGSTRLSR
jgi:Na+-transporting methylmalonyl-CoA/oxaloacetate decarboxylase gamma subunit